MNPGEEVKHFYGPFGWSGEGGGVEGRRVEVIKNKLILCYIYSTLLYSTPLPFPQSKRTIRLLDYSTKR